MMILFASLAFSACAQKKSVRELNYHAVTLHRQGKYSKAARSAKKALKLGKEDYGANHPDMAVLMNILAGIYSSQGKYGKAESLYMKALIFTEKILGQDHPDVAAMAENMAEFYRKTGNEFKAKKFRNHAKGIRSRNRR